MKLTKWSPFVDISEEYPILPAWITLLNLQPHFFSPCILHSIGSLFGRLLRIDNATVAGSRLFVARVLVEIDITKCYPDKV
ncbi:hypothetical protein MA16_Dca006901 [Dendrobium catenatum]|uniref:Uncharacterized protein n=1 Tax=Dendrobium catenatum TaxID=906689 RepID=A0A2I0VT41_9ASPA|nr:hypothetical protein MA16_Dca006901 [Dendrobium catenatum]